MSRIATACVILTTISSLALADRAPYKPPVGLEKLAILNKDFAEKAKKVIAILEHNQWPVIVVWGKRTTQENDVLVKQGVASKDSRHLYCEAVDVIYNDKHEAYSNKHDHPYYMALKAAVAEVGGLRWGGDFKDHWDPTHFELSPKGTGCPGG
jgi:D-alanyl-D-alanine carboxypeptidase-like protein